MKTKTIFTFIFLLSLSFLRFTNPVEQTNPLPPGPNNPAGDFLIGVMESYGDMTNYDLAGGLNLSHSYIGTEQTMYEGRLRYTPYSWVTGSEHLQDGVPVTAINTVMQNLNNHNSRIFWQRPKIEWLCFGQSSIYKAYQENPDYWFYSYNDLAGQPWPDWQYNGGKYVLYCSEPNLGPGATTVLSRLKANTEQCRYDGVNFNQWVQDHDCDWYVKPRIRIPQGIPDETEICKIYVLKQDGITNKTFLTTNVIKAKHLHPAQQTYDGNYHEEFYFAQLPGESPTGIKFQGDLVTNGAVYPWAYNARGTCPYGDPENVNHADIKVEWLGNCEMWIDYVKVENDVANRLLKGNDQEFEGWILNEVNTVKDPFPGSTLPTPYNFYIELFEFNNIPCMAYVNKKIRQHSGYQIGLMADLLTQYNIHMPWGERGTLFTPEKLRRMFFDRTEFPQVFIGDPYPITADKSVNCGGTQQYNQIPETFNLPVTDNDLFVQTPPATYDAWLQGLLDTVCVAYEGGLDPPEHTSPIVGDFRFLMQNGNKVSRECDKPFIAMLQAHQWYSGGEIDREPTNEEQNLMVNEAVSYGAKGIVFWWFPSFGNINSCDYSYGFIKDGHPRDNLYGQDKWGNFQTIIQRLKSWGPTLMSFDNKQTRSYIYRLERNELLSETYFYDVASYIWGNDQPVCNIDAPDTTDAPPPENLKYECKEDRYLQVATFKTGLNDPDNYFMIVNKRCSPVQEITHNDGKRYVRVFFDRNSQQLEAFSNWSIFDLETGDEIDVVDIANVTPYADLGWFDPGEGKLYKMVSTVKSGGILAGDENITGESFTCEAPVYNNGYNITIGANTTIHFNDSSKFVMDGGVFTVGDQNTSAPQNITSDAVPGGSWSGHSFTNCEVKIYGANFSGLANDTTYAVNIIDCPVVDIRNCTFNTNSSLKGGVNAICFDNPFIAINNIYIGSNTFNSSGSTIPTVNVSSYAGVTTPLIIENNIFNEGNTAVFLSGVVGGAIKGNTITDNYIAINALTSSIDVVQNNVSSTVNGSMGIFAAGGSELKLNSSGAFTLGGLNNISNEGTGTNNINVDGSYFLLDDGENIFNTSSDQSSYHLYGYFPMFTAVTTEETNNCFKVDDSPVDPPVNMVTSGYQGSQITFNFIPYLTGCEIIGGGDGLAINLGDGIYDTIYTGGSGSGGSQSSVASVRRTDIKQSSQTSRLGGFRKTQHAFDLQYAKEKYDSISVLMRYRNYTMAKTKCLDLINTYPDSIQSIFAVSKLFLATVANDTSYSAANNLKIFYENLILNHSNNTSLVKRANYYILKCKVRMREYSQALAGFQQIINQNPYSYEGLIARWDYMATSLLAPQGGSFGSEPTVSVRDDNSRLSIDIVNALQNEAEDDDKSPFSKEQRQYIRKSINTAIEISKNDDETKIKTLEEKSELGDVNASKELTQMKSLKQVVKTEKPKSITQHVRIVSEDIRKVFGSNTSSKGNEPKNIPLVFRISQNYPNPFNPVTKINYDLPRDSKVKIVIYDILGREVKRLVNNELKTVGSYIVVFNASNYASGVYFYRIEAEEPNGNKFVDSKKMVLLK